MASLEEALAFFDAAEQRLGTAVVDAVPEGFFSVATFANERGYSVGQMKKKLDKMLAAGFAEAIDGRVGVGRHHTKFYRIKPPKTN